MADEETVKTDAENTNSEDTQSNQNEETHVNNETEDLSVLPEWAQNRLKKTEEERENYKKALDSKKKFKKSLEVDHEEGTQTEDKGKEASEEGNDAEKLQKETLTQAEKVAKDSATKVLEKANEETAIDEWLSSHPEFNDAEKWGKLVANYSPKSGRKTVKAILKDLDRAHYLTRYDAGEIDKITQEAEENGERRGKAEAQVEDLHTVSRGGVKKGAPDGMTAIEKRLSGDLPPGF